MNKKTKYLLGKNGIKNYEMHCGHSFNSVILQ